MWAKCKMRTLNTKLIFQINYGTYMYLKSDIKAGFYLLCFCNPILGNQPKFVSKYVQRYIRKLANTNTLLLKMLRRDQNTGRQIQKVQCDKLITTTM